MTTRSAYAHRLAGFELSMGQGLAVTDSGLLHIPPISSANWTNTGRLVGRKPCVGGAKDLLLAAVTDRADQGPKIGNYLKG